MAAGRWLPSLLGLFLLLPAAAAAETLAELRTRFEREKEADFQTRIRTVQAISALGTEKALRFLVRVAEKDDESSIRSNTVYQIARMELPGAFTALVRLYRERDALRSQVFSAVASYRTEALPADILDEALGGRDVGLRSSAVRYLGRRKDTRFLSEVRRFLKDFPRNPTSVVQPLTQHASAAAARLLVTIYDDARQYDRDTIAKMFAEAGPEVRAVLAEAIASGADPEQAHAAQIAARAGVKEAEAALVAAVAKAEGDRKALLVESLGAVEPGTEAARDLLLALLGAGDDAVVVAAVRALRRAPVKRAIPVLIELLESEGRVHPAEVAVTLGRITGQQFDRRVDLWTAWWREYGDGFSLEDVRPPDPSVLDQALVDLAIERGAAALSSAQGKDPPWVYAGHPLGTTALVVLALHAAGTDPKDRGFKAAVRYLLDQPVPSRTYDLGIEAMALAAVNPKRHKRRIGECAKRIAELQNGEGFWGYPTGNGDHSNSQYAVLGLRAAARAGVRIKRKVWQEAFDHFLATQNEDGGWSYVPGPRSASSSSMTSAGVASLLVLLENMNPSDEKKERLLAAIDRGFDALGELMKLDKDSLYALYGIERAGILGRRTLFGSKPWYVPGARRLLGEQGRDGFWRGGYNEFVQTAFAILFLKKATAPIVYR